MLSVTALSICIVAAAMVATYLIQGQGKIISLGLSVYGDSDLSEKITTIDWGTLYPGASSTKYIWVVLEGDLPAILSLQTEAWAPSEAGSFLSLSWNYQGGVVQPGGVMYATLVLSVSPNTVNIADFTFNIVITATAV